jgi:hypothetical protein
VIPTLEALEIDRLSVAEKVELIVRIWESLPADAVPELPQRRLDDLKRRLARPAAVNEVWDRNWNVACAINDEARRNPQSPYAGKYVGLAKGQVVAVADDLHELVRQLCAAEPEPSNRFLFAAGVKPSLVEEIWSLR